MKMPISHGNSPKGACSAPEGGSPSLNITPVHEKYIKSSVSLCNSEAVMHTTRNKTSHNVTLKYMPVILTGKVMKKIICHILLDK